MGRAPLFRNVGEVRVPKVGWVRFRWSRAVPPGVKSYRVTMDRAGRWHVAFARSRRRSRGLATDEIVGLDRGVAVSVALSTGELLHAPGLTAPERRRCGGWSVSSPARGGVEPPRPSETRYRAAARPRDGPA